MSALGIVVAAVTILVAAAFVVLGIACPSGLAPGDRVRIAGGACSDHVWPSVGSYRDGEITGFVAVVDAPPAAIVRIDHALTARSITSPFVMLHLANGNRRWKSRGTVDVELLPFPPLYDKSSRPDKARWILANASYVRVGRSRGWDG
jgi:hypothetical protein